MKSFSEIDTTVKRASKSIGFEWGVAEELGKNIRLLEYQVPPLYDDVPMVVPAPDYEEDDPRRPLTAPPQY